MGAFSLKIIDTFTELGASAHKSINVDLTYTPKIAGVSSAGAAAPVGIASKVTLTTGMTRNAASSNYQGLAWAVQGQIHLPTGGTYAGQAATDPGMILAGLRGVLTDAGTSTYTNGTLTAAYLESQVSQDVTAGDFRHFLLWLRNQGSGTATNIDAAIYIDEGDAWGNTIQKGIDMEDTVVGIEINSTTTGIDFQGAYSNAAIDLTDVALNYGGSSGPVMIRAGTYGSPVSSSDSGQSGMIRLYGLSTATSDTESSGYYDRGIFSYLRTDGSKGIFPIAGLAEVRTVSGDGPLSVQAGQFIAGLHTSGAKLAATAGTTDGMFALWAKVYSVSGSVAAATSRTAAIWLDNSMGGTVDGEHYSAFITSGGIKADAVFGLETGAGWEALFYFDETAYDQAPISNLGAKNEVNSDKSIVIDLNGTAYYIPIFVVANME